MSRSIAIALAIAVIGCKGRPAPEETPASTSPLPVSSVAPLGAEDRKATEDVAMAYLAAMGSKDCTTLLKIVANYKAPDCKEDVNEWVEHNTQFIAIESIVRDGRDKNAILVTTKMSVSGKERPLIVRLVRDGAEWQVHK